MSVCVHVYVHVFVPVCMCLYACARVCMLLYVYVYMCACVYVFMCLCVCVYVCLGIYKDIAWYVGSQILCVYIPFYFVFGVNKTEGMTKCVEHCLLVRQVREFEPLRAGRVKPMT